MLKFRSIIVWLLFLLPIAVFASSGGEGGHEPSITHRMMLLVIQLGCILFAARLGNMLFERLKMPGVLGELIAGIVIGPYALGAIALPGFAEGVFPIAAGTFPITPELYGMGAVAAIVLLFDVGLETDLKLLLRYSLAGSLVGIGGVVFSFGLGVWSTSAFSKVFLGLELPFFHPVCLFMGIASTATSVGITARILSEKKKLDSPEGVTVLSAAVIDDVIGMILLAVVLGIAMSSQKGGGVDWGHIAGIGAKAVTFWLVTTLLGILASRKISFLLKLFRDRTAIGIMALGLALILAGLFEEVGLAMIIGAYVMGLSLSQADINHLVREKLHPIYAFLVPVFFCMTGMLINLKALCSGPVIAFGLIYTVFALLAKVLGGGLPALMANFNLRGAMRIGFGMAPRGEVGLIIAGIGLSTRLMADGSPLPDSLFAAVIIMVVVNTLLAPPILVALFKKDVPGTRKQLGRDTKEEKVTVTLPSEQMTEFFAQKLLDEFEDEGFFAHLLNREFNIYQLRKDASIIEFQYHETELTFNCNAADRSFVQTAMHEAAASLEDALRGLREPLDSRSISGGMLGNESGDSRKFDLGQYLTPRHIIPRLRSTTKEGVIDELLELLYSLGELADIEEGRRGVWERENKMSTGLEAGVAIPHAKTDAVKNLVCAIGICPEGIDYKALDGKPSTIFVITISPKSRPAPHIQFMSAVSQLMTEDGRNFILNSTSRDEICDLFSGKLSKEHISASSEKVQVTEEFSFQKYIRQDLIKIGLDVDSPEAAVDELLQVMAAQNVIRDPEKIAGQVLLRERKMATSMPEGIALPHARTADVDNLVCAIGVTKSAIDYRGDGQHMVRIVALVLVPDEGEFPYVQFIADLVKCLGANTRNIVAATTSKAVFRVIK